MRTLTQFLLLAALATGLMFLAPAFESHRHTMPGTSEVMPEEYYARQWKKVQEALDKGLPKTALEVVEEIYARARKEQNQQQIIKSTAYRVALQAETSDDGENILIKDIEKAIRDSEHPVKAIFQSMLADLYWNYYQMNRWKINQRTQVEDTTSLDFRTWDATVFFDTTSSLYLASLEPEAILQKTSVSDYREILNGSSESATYRPTMYDILAYRALDFFQKDETHLPKATQEFEVTSLDAVQPVDMFLSHSFGTPDPRDP